eukprot:TRINITY_DN8034_c1_g1_i1.p1 TRINITY_DN8034_c1_g1~~TRINITY_DN8034_c1_g1_i1.p1  ORF type:complete len:364 (+),score=136.87 TRINITY_DN8034_c1_g1_i1:95-1186(+)
MDEQKQEEYWCHTCHGVVVPDYTNFSCTICGNDFLEIVDAESPPDGYWDEEEEEEEDFSDEEEYDDEDEMNPWDDARMNPGGFSTGGFQTTQIVFGPNGFQNVSHQGGGGLQNMMQQMMMGFNQQPQGTQQGQQQQNGAGMQGMDPMMAMMQQFQQQMQQTMQAQQQAAQGGVGGAQGTPGMTGLVGMLNGLLGGMQGMGGMGAANPGDYFQGNLEQLMEQLSGQGGKKIDKTSKVYIENIPKVKFSRKTMEDLPCAICQEGFEEGEQVSELVCKHQYHHECILPWLDINSTCPVCRAKLPITDDEARAILESGKEGEGTTTTTTAGDGKDENEDEKGEKDDQGNGNSSNGSGGGSGLVEEVD